MQTPVNPENMQPGCTSPIVSKSVYGMILTLGILVGLFVHAKVAAQTPTKQDPGIPVHYTDMRQAAGITFQQDSTQTEEKYYLETMGTGVAWLDYDQDGLMDLFFVQSAATDIYKPPHPCAARFTITTATGPYRRHRKSRCRR